MTDTTTRPLAATSGPATGTAPPAILTATAIALGVVTVMALLLGLIAHAVSPAAPSVPAASTSAEASAPAAATPSAAPASPTAPVAQEPITTAPGQPASGTTTAPTGHTHVVASGETLARIAVHYQVPTELIAADNGLSDPDLVRAGQPLSISVPPTGVDVMTPGTTLGGYAHDHATTVAALQALNPQIADPDRIQAGQGLRIARS